MELPSEVVSSATAMIRAHGAQAGQECQYMIGRLTRRGDVQGQEVWRAILSAVEAAQGGT